jgi:protein-disulfide isomerase
VPDDAGAAPAAADQDAFWEMHDLLLQAAVEAEQMPVAIGA